MTLTPHPGLLCLCHDGEYNTSMTSMYTYIYQHGIRKIFKWIVFEIQFILI